MIEGAEGVEGPLMEGPELVAVPVLLWLGWESPSRVEEVAAGLGWAGLGWSLRPSATSTSRSTSTWEAPRKVTGLRSSKQG